jgi:polysaccharide biosynthesis/export protein
VLLVLILALGPGLVSAGAASQQPPAAPVGHEAVAPSRAAGPAADTSAEYIIGPEDVLSIVYWREKDMTGDVAVRSDGKISLPLLNDVQAAGLTPTQLRDWLVGASKEYFEDPAVSVVVKQMNSRKVFITGEVSKPGPYPLVAPTTVLELISLAGGLKDYADRKNILIVRNENGRQTSHLFNYKDVVSGKNLAQNIQLKPHDTVIVP